MSNTKTGAKSSKDQELWIGFARDAMSRYVIPDKIDDTDNLVDDMADVCATYADEMLDRYKERFGP